MLVSIVYHSSLISVPVGVLRAVDEPAAGLPTLDGLPKDAGGDAVTTLLLPVLTL